MRKTILCHFFNEEWILPFWLKHHRDIFDHGIMINYASTDRSCDIIREYCPTWEIRESRNPHFGADAVDSEVTEIETGLEGWRVCLNAPEFLVGNYNHLDDRPEQTRIYLPQYMFTDMERREEPYFLDVNRPLWEQRWYGYGPVLEFATSQSHGSPPRALRSIHNYAAGYPVTGRHFTGETPSYHDLAIFYYGYASLEESSIKMQIQTKIPHGHTNHHFSLEVLLDRFRLEQQPLSRDIRAQIKHFIEAHTSIILNKNNDTLATQEQLRTTIESLTTLLNQLNK